MVHRSLVTVLAALGAILIVFGGILGFLLSHTPGGFGERYGSDIGVAVYAAIAVILGLVLLVFSGYTQYRGVESSMTGGIVLMVLGAVIWTVVGGWPLVALGSFLAVLAGLILVVECLVGSPRRLETT